ADEDLVPPDLGSRRRLDAQIARTVKNRGFHAADCTPVSGFFLECRPESMVACIRTVDDLVPLLPLRAAPPSGYPGVARPPSPRPPALRGPSASGWRPAPPASPVPARPRSSPRSVRPRRPPPPTAEWY